MTGIPRPDAIPGEPVDAEPGRDATGSPISPVLESDASLLALIDRLAALLERSDLVEIEVEAGGTALILRKPAAIAQGGASAPPAPVPVIEPGPEPPAAPVARAVAAPLTGIFYASPSPTSPPYVAPGREVAVGQVIGLIEAMKLFNEIKSDVAGRVVRVIAQNGELVKARQALIEVEPL